jgi:hypothetical protein
MQKVDIYKYKSGDLRKNKRPKRIIIHHTASLADNVSMKDERLMYDTSKMSYDALATISFGEFGSYRLMCHYYVEQIGNTIVTIQGTGEHVYAPLLKEWVSPVYRDDILVLLAGDYSFDLPSEELYQRLGNTISNLMWRYNLVGYNKVYKMEDLDLLEGIKLRPMTKIDRGILDRYIHF